MSFYLTLIVTILGLTTISLAFNFPKRTTDKILIIIATSILFAVIIELIIIFYSFATILTFLKP